MRTTLTEHLVPALTWTLIHSLWQGLVLTVLAGLIVLLTRRSSAALRYALLCTIFFLFLGCMAACFIIEWNTSDTPANFSRQARYLARPLFDPSLIVQWLKKFTAFLNLNANWIVLGWLTMLTFKSGRMILDLQSVQRLRSSKTLTPVPHWTCRVQMLSRELGIRKEVSLMESVLVKVPIVIGHFKPFILVPAGILTHMPAGQLEAVILHELAHIRRHDYLVNFIQRISELLFFFNPGLLWVSSLLRVERENCCDDMAISRTQNKIQFVEALIRCKEHSLETPGYALGLFGKKNLLLQRLTRIVYNNNNSLSSFEAVFFMLNLVMLFIVLLSMGHGAASVRPVASVISAPYHASPTSSAALSSPPEHTPEKEAPKHIKKPGKLAVINQASVRATLKNIRKLFATKVGSEVRAGNSEGHFRYLFGASAHQPLAQVDGSLSEQMDPKALQVQMERNRKQAEKDREQAEKDRAQAEKDRAQAERDREQARKDRAQAEKDRRQAYRDQQIPDYQ